MPLPAVVKRFLGPAILVLVILAALFLVTVVYATGEALLAGTLLVILALAIWVYASQRTYAYRYLFPGIAAALIFVVFPMVYTVAIGFTNYSSKNLLAFPQATQYLLDETIRTEGATFAFTVHPDGSRFRARLENQDSGTVFITGPFEMPGTPPLTLKAEALGKGSFKPGEPVDLRDIIENQRFLKGVTIALPEGQKVRMTGLSEFAATTPHYQRSPDGSLKSTQDSTVLKPNFKTGFYENAEGEAMEPGFHVAVGWANYKAVFTENRFRGPFLAIFGWTLLFSVLTVVFATSLGMVLAVVLNWEALRFRSVYRLLLFLPYVVPGFISILVFKGLFNNNFGEINLILKGLFGIKPAWFSDPFLAKAMILIVNTWLGFPYMMLVSMGLIKAIPVDLYEASAVAGAGPLTNFFKITLPLILKPLTPLLISSFAFNFNNFVLIALLTGGRPDFVDATIPAGTTDILVSYTYRLAFQDSGQQFGLAAAISTVIFLMVAVISLIQVRYTKIAQDEKR